MILGEKMPDKDDPENHVFETFKDCANFLSHKI